MIEVMFEVMQYFGLNHRHRPSSGVKLKLNELCGLFIVKSNYTVEIMK